MSEEPVAHTMTSDEARAAIARSVAGILNMNVAEAEASLGALQGPARDEPQAVNTALLAIAACELRDSLLLSAKQFDKSSRPRILQPERSLKVVR